MDTKKLQDEIQALEKEMSEKRKRVISLNSQLAEMDITEDYEFTRSDGSKAKLSELFGDQKYLFAIHNMGRGCSYCSMWADGFSSIFHHLDKKGAFVLVSPDSPEIQTEHAKKRDWKFPMVSSQGNTFTQDMGYFNDKDGYWPGVSVFEKSDDGKIKRVNKDFFGPGDAFCSVWSFVDLLPTENVTVNS